MVERLATLIERLRGNLYALELVELTAWGFLLATFVNVVVPSQGSNALAITALVQFFIPAVFVAAWLIYAICIRLARALGGQAGPMALWIGIGFAIFLSGGTIVVLVTLLDLNRFLVSRLLYRGDAPAEYLWNPNSLARRRAWDDMMKERQTSEVWETSEV